MADRIFDLVNSMQEKFGVHKSASEMDSETFWKFIEYRVNVQIREELEELLEAIRTRNAEEIFDALIDIDVFQKTVVDVLTDKETYLEGFKRVMEANLAKEPGIKPGRPNPFGFPDLIKPEGWVAPTHEGLLQDIQDKIDKD